jgi:hypothetical protein
MKKILFLFLFIPLFANSQYRFAFKVANIYSSAYFENNNSDYFLDDDPITRGDYWQGYKTKMQNTLDWPEAASNSFLTDIGRRFSLELSIERKINKNLYLATGFEVGGRFFSVESKTFSSYYNTTDRSFSPLIYRSYRNFSIPVSAAYNVKINNRFSLKPNAGFSINMPESFTQTTFPNIYFVKAFSPFYLMLTIGTEINYNLKKGNGIALTAIYSQGFTNIIKDYLTDQRTIKDSFWDAQNGVYERLDKTWDNKVVVASNGTNFSLGIKYYFLPFGSGTNKLNNKIDFTKIDFTTRQLNNTIDIKLDTNYIKVCVWDDQRIDGDSVALEYKDSLILNNVRLDKTPKCAWIKIEPHQSNYLLIHALNEGRVKPNTVKLVVYNKEKTIEQTIKTDLQKSGIINFTLE